MKSNFPGSVSTISPTSTLPETPSNFTSNRKGSTCQLRPRSFERQIRILEFGARFAAPSSKADKIEPELVRHKLVKQVHLSETGLLATSHITPRSSIVIIKHSLFILFLAATIQLRRPP